MSKVKVIHWPWFKGHSDLTITFFFFLETAWPIEAKFYVETSWDGGTKVWTTGLGHMTKMSTMPIYTDEIWKRKSDNLKFSIKDQI